MHTTRTEGKLDEALALYRRALAAKPDLFEAQLSAGIALDLKGDYAEARKHLTRAIEVAPDQGRDLALAAVGVSYAFQARARDAAIYCQQLFDRQMAGQNLSEAAATANALGRVYLESGDLANAQRWYQTGYETARRQPTLEGPDLDLWQMRWEHAQGRIAARRGNLVSARAHLAALKAIIDNGGPNLDQMPIYWYLAGYLALSARAYDEAVSDLLQADQKDPFILALLAQAYEGAGDMPRRHRSITRRCSPRARTTSRTHSHGRSRSAS